MNRFQFLTRKKPLGASQFAGGRILFDGNSLTAEGYPTYVQAAFTSAGVTASFSNVAISGQQTSDMETRAPSFVDNAWIAGKNNLLVAFEMGNDLLFNSNVTGAQNRFKQYCINRRQNAIANGFSLKIIVVTCTPRSNVSDTLLLPVNDWLITNYKLFSNRVVNLRSDSRLLDINNTTYYRDTVHYTTTGQQIVVGLVYDQIKTL